MTTLPPHFQQFAAFLDAQPSHVQTIFRYCIALVLVQTGHAQLIETTPGESGPLCTFQTTAGDIFTLPKPAISKEQEAALLNQLKDILDDEELL